MDVFFLQWDMIFFRNLGMHKNRARMMFAGVQTYATVLFLLICFFCLKDPLPYGDVLVKWVLEVKGSEADGQRVSVPLRGCVGQILPIRLLDPKSAEWFPSPCGDVLVKSLRYMKFPRTER